MISTYYDQATTAYNAGDFPQALKWYYQCLKEDWSTFGPGDAGLVYHRIGNCLIKMKSFKEAAASYQKALQDDYYGEKTSIHVNLATTLNGIGKYPEAIEYFNKALSDSGYPTPYRAYMGLGTSYFKLQRYVEAGTAYRSAALDESNPNPVKALMSLGEVFTALGRPADAVEAYLAILDFRVTGKSLNGALEKLGQAYVAAGRYQEAANTFEDALRQESFALSDEALADYQKARQALGIGSVQSPTNEGIDQPANEVHRPVQAVPYTPATYNEDLGYGAGNVPHPGDTGFFTATDDELVETSKRRMRSERKLRHTGLKVFFGIIATLFIALGICIIAYVQGMGIPSQETVVQEFFDAHARGNSIDEYWLAGSDKNKELLDRMLDGVAKSSDVTILKIDSGMTESEIIADVKLPEGGIAHYRIEMMRDFISWKISKIEPVFASTA